eukprot:scaffold20224_cov53-Attheya_sp.AAC.9
MVIDEHDTARRVAVESQGLLPGLRTRGARRGEPGGGGEPPISTPSPETKSGWCKCKRYLERMRRWCMVKAHVNSLGAALFDRVINDASGTNVVNLERCRWLQMAHFVQDDMEGNALVGVEETGSQFSFSGGGQDDIED